MKTVDRLIYSLVLAVAAACLIICLVEDNNPFGFLGSLIAVGFVALSWLRDEVHK